MYSCRAVQRVLFTRALRNPASSYGQGMNELSVPFFIGERQYCKSSTVPFIRVRNIGFLSEFKTVRPTELDVSKITASHLRAAEADCYWCFCKFLDTLQTHYTFGQPGIQEAGFKVKEVW